MDAKHTTIVCAESVVNPYADASKPRVDITGLPTSQASGRIIAAVGRLGWLGLHLAGNSVCWRNPQSQRIELLDGWKLQRLILDHVAIVRDGRSASVTPLLREIQNQLRLALPEEGEAGR